jgi:hypothetical protein
MHIVGHIVGLFYKYTFMANQNWVKGGSSPNPQGRPKKKRSSEPIARLIERFVQRNITPRKLQQIYDKLESRDRLLFLVDLLPYAVSKKPTQATIGIGQLSDPQLNELYDAVMSSAGILQEPEDIESEVIPFAANEQQLLQNGTTG